MKYCTRCILPDTRPNLVIEEDGVCNACRAHGTRPDIDWTQREQLWREVVANAKSRSGGYDCMVPVSGGKDSTWQVVKCLEYGLNPLAVTWKTPARTEIGQRNLDNLVRLGVDHIDYQVNPSVERRFMLKAYERFGSTAVPMHLALFNIPLSIAAKFEIPLIIWGENSAFEYGGAEQERTGFQLDENWLKKYGVTHGTTASDWLGDDFTRRELTPYYGPTDAELNAGGVLAVFLGYYFAWDPEETVRVASENGFESAETARTGCYEYADIDDDFISIHHYLKWHKFGFNRTFDNLSLEIRNGRTTREAAIDKLRTLGPQTPVSDIEKVCQFMEISVERFHQIAETFRNQNIWRIENGRWVLVDFLIPEWNFCETAPKRAA